MYGLIGRHIGGSFSARWFGERGVDYRNFEFSHIDELPRMLAENPSLRGFNVTSPYKEVVIPFLDALSPTASEVGAVNCVSVECGRLIGHNTDAPALVDVLGDYMYEVVIAGAADAKQRHCGGEARSNPENKHNKLDCFVPAALAMTAPFSALILGSGGAARAAAWALRQLGIEYTVVSRTKQATTAPVPDDISACGSIAPTPYNTVPTDLMPDIITYADLTSEILQANTLIINASPVGMASCPGHPDIPYDALTERHQLFDMIYNPAETEFLHAGRKKGACTLNGLSMLIRQAELSAKVWGLEGVRS